MAMLTKPGTPTLRMSANNSQRGATPRKFSRTIARERRYSDLLRFQLLRLHDWTNWGRWFEAAEVATKAMPGPVINRASMLIDAAIDGQGIALARTALAALDLIHGRLARPVDVRLGMLNTYWVVSPKANARVPKIAMFRQWLLAQAADDARQLAQRADMKPNVATVRRVRDL